MVTAKSVAFGYTATGIPVVSDRTAIFELDPAMENAEADFTLLDLSAFWGISEQKQVAYLCNYYKGKMTPEDINAKFSEDFRLQETEGLSQFGVLVGIAGNLKQVKSMARQA